MKKEIIELIFESVDEINIDLDVKLEKSEGSALFGSNSVLDSIDLVNFISIVEQKLEDKYGDYISIADENAMSQSSSPFRTIETLTEYILTIIN
ncbi:hypothetical protein ACFLSI_03520 [Bacteroidota bacterium]